MKAFLTLPVFVALLCVGCDDDSSGLEQRCGQLSRENAAVHGQLEKAREQHRRELAAIERRLAGEKLESRAAQERIAELEAALQLVRDHIDSRTGDYDEAMKLYENVAMEDFADSAGLKAHAERLDKIKRQIDSNFSDYRKFKSILESVIAASSDKAQ